MNDIAIFEESVINENQNINTGIENFINSIDCADTTKEAYKKGIKYFFNFIHKEGITNLTQSDIIKYKQYLIENHQAPSINLYLTAIKKLYGYLNKHYNIIDLTEDIKGVKISKEHKKDGLTTEQAKELLKAPTNKRDKAIITLLLTAALREIELERANIEDIQTKGNSYILQVQGKGHIKKDDYVIITKTTYNTINEYLATRKNVKASDPLFISDSNNNNNGRLTTRSIRRIVKKHLQNIGINTPKITTHSLRHTAITQVIMNGGDLLMAQKLARHSNPNTTQIYIDEIADNEKKAKSAEILDNLFFI